MGSWVYRLKMQDLPKGSNANTLMKQELVKLGNEKCRKMTSTHGKMKFESKFSLLGLKSVKSQIIFSNGHSTPSSLKTIKKSFSSRIMVRA